MISKRYVISTKSGHGQFFFHRQFELCAWAYMYQLLNASYTLELPWNVFKE